MRQASNKPEKTVDRSTSFGAIACASSQGPEREIMNEERDSVRKTFGWGLKADLNPTQKDGGEYGRDCEYHLSV